MPRPASHQRWPGQMIERDRPGAPEGREIGRLPPRDTLRVGHRPRVDLRPLLQPGGRIAPSLRRGPKRSLAAAAEIAVAPDVGGMGDVVDPNLEFRIAAEPQPRGEAADAHPGRATRGSRDGGSRPAYSVAAIGWGRADMCRR